MAYLEVRMVDIDQVIRRWLTGEKTRAIARSTGSDRNTVRRIVRFAEEAGIWGDTPWPKEGKLQAIRQRMGRPGTTVAVGEAEERLKPRTDQMRAWLDKDRLLLTKVHELLGREGRKAGGMRATVRGLRRPSAAVPSELTTCLLNEQLGVTHCWPLWQPEI